MPFLSYQKLASNVLISFASPSVPDFTFSFVCSQNAIDQNSSKKRVMASTEYPEILNVVS